VRRYGADQFAYMTGQAQAVIAFVSHGKQVRFILPMPDANETRFTHTPERGIMRTAQAAEREYEQAVKQKWRALNLVVKAKLEAVEAGIVTFEQEFGMHLVLPGGRSVADEVLPAIEAAYAGSAAPLLQIGGAS
jgi:hypothetical protein